jgi:hypothetical protein
MENVMTAIEMTGTVDQQRHIQLDEALPFSGPRKVRVIILYSSADEMDETEWLYAAARNPAFTFLHDPEEDIYTLADGKPLDDEE